MTTTWRAIHVYCDDQDTVLADVIEPVISAARRHGLVRRTFFLRYWNGGPHLRLRFETPAHAGDPTTELADQIRDRTSSLPRQRWDERSYRDGAEAVLRIERSLGGPGGETVEPLQADGDVHPRGYTFDHGRYGAGSADVVHDHFSASSHLAFAVVLLVRGRPALRQLLATYCSAAVTLTSGWELARTPTWFREMASWNGSVPAGTAAGAPEGLSEWITNGRLPDWPEAVTQVVTAWATELERYAVAVSEQPDEQGLPVGPALLDAVHLFANRIGLGLDQECQVYDVVANVSGLPLGRGELSAR